MPNLATGIDTQVEEYGLRFGFINKPLDDRLSSLVIACDRQGDAAGRPSRLAHFAQMFRFNIVQSLYHRPVQLTFNQRLSGMPFSISAIRPSRCG
jgi:hypothetical protein